MKKTTISNRWKPLEKFRTDIGNAIPLRSLRRYCTKGLLPARMYKGNWYIDMWLWEGIEEDYKTIQEESDQIEPIDQVKGEIGVSIRPTRGSKRIIP